MRNRAPPSSNCQNEMLAPTHHTEVLLLEALCVPSLEFSFIYFRHRVPQLIPSFIPLKDSSPSVTISYFPLSPRHLPQNSHVCIWEGKLHHLHFHSSAFPCHQNPNVPARSSPATLSYSPATTKWELLKHSGRWCLHMPFLCMLLAVPKSPAFCLLPTWVHFPKLEQGMSSSSWRHQSCGMTEGWSHMKPIQLSWFFRHTVSEHRLAANSIQTYKPQQTFLWTGSNLQVCFIQFQVASWKFHCALHAAPINDVSNRMRTSAKMKNSSDSNVLALYHMWEHARTSSMHTITAVTNQKLFTVNGLLLYCNFCQETIFKKYLCAIYHHPPPIIIIYKATGSLFITTRAQKKPACFSDILDVKQPSPVYWSYIVCLHTSSLR